MVLQPLESKISIIKTKLFVLEASASVGRILSWLRFYLCFSGTLYIQSLLHGMHAPPLLVASSSLSICLTEIGILVDCFNSDLMSYVLTAMSFTYGHLTLCQLILEPSRN